MAGKQQRGKNIPFQWKQRNVKINFMEAMPDLITFAKILTDKGYNGYFLTQAGYPGRLKDSISGYLENCRTGTEGTPKPVLLVSCFLQWNGEDKPCVQCHMWVKYQDEKFDLTKMEVTKKDRYGQLLKKSELANLSAIGAPNAKEAIAMVNDPPRQKVVPHRGFRR